MALQEKLLRKLVDFGLWPVGNTKGAAVLMYHGVVDGSDPRINTRSVSTEEFAEHLKGFKKHFHISTIEDVFKGDIPDDRFSIALSFDDGLLNNYTNALPLLEKFDVPATFFITGANQAGMDILWGELVDLIEKSSIDRPIEFEDEIATENGHGKYQMNGSGEMLRNYIKRNGNERTKSSLYEQFENDMDRLLSNTTFQSQWKLMNDEQIGNTKGSGLITIGSHGYRHLELGSISQEEASEDLKNSKKYLDELLIQDTDLLAYPSGSYQRDTIRIAEDVGFKRQLAVDILFDEDPEDTRLMERYGVYSFPCSNRFFNYLITQNRINSSRN